ncbi:endonuclease/exonuclease/phosphatase family protein [Deinococcus radiophilus]|uniref:endonuclease/exonuclease/phosphatase family protein n=1 Tax=Deinococcus radiophilus TaxID=32062 RepID=UPI00360AB2F8
MDAGQGCWNGLRVGQAQALLAFTDRLEAATGDSDVLLMGDFNAYSEEDPIRTLEAAGYVNGSDRLPAEDRYSYQFGGQFGSLDHALASGSLNAQLSGVTEWHINSDEPTLADYNVEYKANPECRTGVCTSPDLYGPGLPRQRP